MPASSLILIFEKSASISIASNAGVEEVRKFLRPFTLPDMSAADDLETICRFSIDMVSRSVVMSNEENMTGAGYESDNIVVFFADIMPDMSARLITVCMTGGAWAVKYRGECFVRLHIIESSCDAGCAVHAEDEVQGECLNEASIFRAITEDSRCSPGEFVVMLSERIARFPAATGAADVPFAPISILTDGL